jgi:hypothetical protein
MEIECRHRPWAAAISKEVFLGAPSPVLEDQQAQNYRKNAFAAIVARHSTGTARAGGCSIAKRCHCRCSPLEFARQSSGMSELALTSLTFSASQVAAGIKYLHSALPYQRINSVHPDQAGRSGSVCVPHPSFVVDCRDIGKRR